VQLGVPAPRSTRLPIGTHKAPNLAKSPQYHRRRHLPQQHNPKAEAAITKVAEEYGRVDGVVNCVGSIVLKSAHTTSDADFEQVRWVGGWVEL